jgi:hypothetical protein
VPRPGDQHPVGDLSPDGAHPALGIGAAGLWRGRDPQPASATAAPWMPRPGTARPGCACRPQPGFSRACARSAPRAAIHGWPSSPAGIGPPPVDQPPVPVQQGARRGHGRCGTDRADAVSRRGSGEHGIIVPRCRSRAKLNPPGQSARPAGLRLSAGWPSERRFGVPGTLRRTAQGVWVPGRHPVAEPPAQAARGQGRSAVHWHPPFPGIALQDAKHPRTQRGRLF